MTSFTTLYSGSSGNSVLVQCDGRCILVDVGKNCKCTVESLTKLGIDPKQVDMVAVTHDHSDHIQGLRVFLKKYQTPVCASRATLDSLISRGVIAPEHPMVCTDDAPMVHTDNFDLFYFATPHDAEGSLAYVILTKDGKRVAVATDMGHLPKDFYGFVSGCDGVVLESNYDEDMLYSCGYPYYLKRRIKSDYGHLSNVDCAKTVWELYQTGVKKFVLAHLSINSNYPDLAFATTESYLKRLGVSIEDICLKVAPRNDVMDMIEV